MSEVKLLDRRLVYGARCTWWDSIDKIGKTPTRNGVSLPCCPHCGGMLFEMENEKPWWEGVERYEREKPDPGYRKLVEWSRGKCFSGWPAAKTAFATAPSRDK